MEITKKTTGKIFGILLFTILLSGCKPTEKGYKAAYDAALTKREAANADLGLDVPEGALQQVDGPQLKTIEGEKVYVLHQRLKPLDEEMKLPHNFNVAVGCFKMPTNCKALAEDLKKEGLEAFPTRDTEGKFYTIAASFKSQKEAITFSKEYEKKKGRTYVGLPGAPVIIYSPR